MEVAVGNRRPEHPHPSSRRSQERRGLGRLGEDLAARHFESLGFSTLARGARTRAGEIDLILFDGRTIVFAEVKTRRGHTTRSNASGDVQPLAGLRPRQRARLRRLASAWLSTQRSGRPRARAIRFDAVGVLIDEHNRLLRLDHVEAAW